MDFARQAEARNAHSEVVLRAMAQIAGSGTRTAWRRPTDRGWWRPIPRRRPLTGSWPGRGPSQRANSGKSSLWFKQAWHGQTAGTERTLALRELADWQVLCGKFAEAVVNYELVLGEQEADDSAIRGYAKALFWAGRHAEADSVYQAALLRRSGVVSLRLEYARALILVGRLDDAARQIGEAVLNPGDGRILAHQAWLAARSGDGRELAKTMAEAALAQYPDDALVQVLTAKALGQKLAVPEVVPRWFYNTKEAAFKARDFWDATTVALLSLD